MTKTVGEIAAHLGAQVLGDSALVISGVGSLATAGPSEVAFVESAEKAEAARASSAGCLIVPSTVTSPGKTKTVIPAAHPKLAFAETIKIFHPSKPAVAGTHPSAVIAVGVRLGEGVTVGPSAVIGTGVQIGAGTRIGAGVYVGEGCVIGDQCELHPNVTVYARTTLGARVVVHAGTVLGSDGFGYVTVDGVLHKFPQIGQLIIEDDVEIGANTTIDRGALDATVIGRGTKIDNLVQIAHNVSIGEHCAVSAQVGVAGSSRLESNVVAAGQVGIADHVTIGEGAILGAQAGIPTGKKIRPKEVVWGTPARPLSEFKTQYAALSHLPQWRTDLKALEQRLADLEHQQDERS